MERKERTELIFWKLAQDAGVLANTGWDVL
jgi:hypothetical protein